MHLKDQLGEGGLVDFPLSMPFKAKYDIGADFQERIASSVASSEWGMSP
jgi:hypothetical protein